MFADALGVSEACIKHYANGTRNIPARHFKKIIQASGGVITVEGLLSGYEAA